MLAFDAPQFWQTYALPAIIVVGVICLIVILARLPMWLIDHRQPWH